MLAQGKPTARDWVVSKVSDTKGNYFTVTYINDTTNGQVYPSRIDYTANDGAALAAYNTVQFIYSTRPDITPLYHAGSLMKTTVRLTNVKSYVGSSLVNDYRLAYQQASSSQHSLLTSVAQCASDGSCLPATSFLWSTGGTGTFSIGWEQKNYPTDGRIWRVGVGVPGGIDLNTDGRADILQIAENDYQAQVLLSNGDGTFALGWEQINYPIDGKFWRAGYATTFVVSLGTEKTYFLQIAKDNYTAQLLAPNSSDAYGIAWQQQNYPTDGPIWAGAGETHPVSLGDGKTGFLQLTSTDNKAQLLLPNTDGSYWAAWKQSNYPNDGPFWSVDSAATYPIDVYGDSRTSFLQIKRATYVAQVLVPNSDGTYRVAWQQVNYPNDGRFWRIDSNAYTSYLVDANGDGKTDVLQIGNPYYQAQLLLGRGDGSFQLAWQQNNYPSDGGFWRIGDAHTAYPIDANGDGRTDILQIANATYTAQLLLANADGTYRVAWQQNNFPTDGKFWRTGRHPTFFADYYGSGKPSVLQVDLDTYTAQILRPDGDAGELIKSMSTGLGVVTSVTYQPLTNSAVYSKDSSATYPVIDLIMAMQVVSRVDTSNGVGGTSSTSYTYAGAKADQNGRGFLGFRQMTVTDMQTSIAQTTTYRQDFPYVSLAASEARMLGAQTLNQVTNTYGATALGGTRYQVFLTQSVAASSDLDGSVLPTITSAYQYDSYGNATEITVSASDGHSKVTTNTYANDAANWLLGRLTAASVNSTSP